ncbi:MULTISPECIES: hypothetical protein [Pseudomonas]|uniref:hypothetical protein n=1 Tax=Pseudomonas TaxID=286 RepID=UPI00117BC166|nr:MULTISPECIES: hypothetical protein [Pseudomonas]
MKIIKSDLFKVYLFLLFPGYFFFHVFHSMGYVPYFGWFGAFALAGTLLITLSSILKKRNPITEFTGSALLTALPSVALLIYMTLITLINHVVYPETKYFDDAGLRWSLTNILLLAALFVIGANLKVKVGKKYKALIFIVYAGFAFFTWEFYSKENFTMILPVVQGGGVENTATYQSLAMCVLYTSLILCPFIDGRNSKIFLMTASTAILYFIGSRTEFFLLIAVIPAFMLIQYGLKASILMSILLSPLAVYAALSFGLNDRFISVFGSSQSMDERTMLFQAGIEGILRNPFVGDYLGQVRDFGNAGAYIHNILSVYQQYGILAFSMFIALTMCSIMTAFKYFRYARSIPQVEILVYSVIVSTIGIIVSKPIGWPYPAFAWGTACFVMNLMNKRRKVCSASVEHQLQVSFADPGARS